jgi:hypothetical protein
MVGFNFVNGVGEAPEAPEASREFLRNGIKIEENNLADPLT